MSRVDRVIVLLLLAVGGAACAGPAPGKEAHLHRGDALSAEGRWTEALAEYRDALAIDQTYGEASARVADALEHTNPGDVASIRRERLLAAQALPGNNDVQFKAGMLFADIRNWDEVDLRADFILKNDPNSWQGQLLKGEAAAGRNDRTRALELLQGAVKSAPNAAPPQVALGRLYLSEQQREQAEASFLRAVELEPQLPAAHAALGELYWTTGRAADAEPALKKAVQLDPGEARSLRTLVRLYETEGRIAEAEAPLKALAALRRDLDSQLALADYYIRTDRLADAEKMLSGGATGEGRSDRDRRLVEVAFRRNQKADAYRRIDAVLAKDATNVEWLDLKARLLMDEGRLDDASVPALLAVKANPDSEDAHFLLGTIQSERGDVTAAIEAFTRAMSRSRQPEAALNAIVELRVKQGSREALDDAADRVVRARTGPAPALTLTRALLQRGELRRAETLLTTLLAQHQGVAAVHAQAGRLRMLENRPTDARAEFDRALALNPRLAEALRGRVELELQATDVAAARGLVDEHLKTVVSVPNLLLASRVYDAAGDGRQAEAALRRVLDMNPADDTAMNALVRLFEKQGRLDQMRLEYEAAAKKPSDSGTAATLVGLILEAQDKRADAERAFESALAKVPSAPVALASLARLYSVGARNRLDRALELALRARLSLPDSPELAATLGWIYYRQDRAGLAVPRLEAGVAGRPNNPLFWYRLGLAYALSGNRTGARDSIERAIRLRPDYPQALEARADLRRGVTPQPQLRARRESR